MSDRPNMRLDQLIDELAKFDGKRSVEFEFCGFAPVRLTSYRGWYEHLAMVPAKSTEVTVDYVLDLLRRAKSETFFGWKGGEYHMRGHTPLWVDCEGEATRTKLVGVREVRYQYEGGYVLLETEHGEYL